MKYEWKIIGHDTQLINLEKEIDTNNLSHAYLFSGPDQIGKYSISKKFAQILQCKHNFCKVCHDCKLIEKEAHLDTIFYRNNNNIISIEEVRNLQNIISRSHNSRYRIIIMEDIERMPIPSQNAFLKILEEPPLTTIFILTTKNISSILPTITSRVRQYYFYPSKQDLIRTYLQNAPNIENIIALSNGKIGLAKKLRDDFECYEKKIKIYSIIHDFFKDNSIVKRFKYIESIHKDPDTINEFLEIFLSILRANLKKLIYKKNNELNIPLIKNIYLIEKILETFSLIKSNINKRLALENLLLSF